MSAPRPLPDPVALPESTPESAPPEFDDDAPSPGRPSRSGWLIALLAAAAAAGWWAMSEPGRFGGGSGEGVGVRTATAAKGDLRKTIRVGGSVAALRFAAIRAPRIRRGRRQAGGGGGSGGGGLTLIRMAEPGSTVQSGQVVAEFDRQSQQQLIDDQETQVTQAESTIDLRRANLMVEMETLRQQLKTARAEHEKAELDLRTAEVKSEIEAEILAATMHEAQATADELQTELAQREIAHRAALRQVEIDRDQEMVDLKRAEMNADRLLMRTPISGIVVMQTIFRGGSFSQSAAGDEVNSGSYFMQIVDPSEMVLQAVVNQADIQQLRVGQPAEIRLDAYSDKTWPGEVASVAALAGGGTGGGRYRSGTGNYVRNVTVTLRIFDADPRIIPDLSASADILIAEQHDVLIAPREALEQNEDGWFVWLQRSADEFVQAAVEIGTLTDTEVALLAGVREGDRLALESPPTDR